MIGIKSFLFSQSMMAELWMTSKNDELGDISPVTISTLKCSAQTRSGRQTS
ncbi:MAG: hypothetical protein ACPL7K_06635 [Armatimonadota bacterium]